MEPVESSSRTCSQKGRGLLRYWFSCRYHYRPRRCGRLSTGLMRSLEGRALALVSPAPRTLLEGHGIQGTANIPYDKGMEPP